MVHVVDVHCWSKLLLILYTPLLFSQGALVPLSDEVIEHLQMEGCNVLAQRLALLSGASVKMINGMFCSCICTLYEFTVLGQENYQSLKRVKSMCYNLEITAQ